MTTTQPAALPELIRMGYEESGDNPDDWRWQLAHEAERLAALQPADVSDEQIVNVFLADRDDGSADSAVRIGRAILALRPAQQATPEPVGEPYGWVYTNSQGARVLHLEPSARLDADKQAAATWPNHHKCIPVYTQAPQKVPMADEVRRSYENLLRMNTPNGFADRIGPFVRWLQESGITAEAKPASRVDCGECPNVTSGCEAGRCMKAAKAKGGA